MGLFGCGELWEVCEEISERIEFVVRRNYFGSFEKSGFKGIGEVKIRL